jgi:voltage-gated potassium channel
MRNPWLVTTGRHIALLLFLSTLLILLGTLGYVLIEGFPVLDALYMTVITLSTVGYGEVQHLHQSGRVFTMLLIFMGAGFVAYNLAYFSRVLLDGNLLELYRRRKLNKQLDTLSDHFIVCGYGQMGQIVVEELTKSHIHVVAIEKEPSVVQRIQGLDIIHLTADATEEESLLRAGISRARGIISLVTRDAENVYIVLTARDLNRELRIFARAGTPGAEKRLLKAGANRVVSPYASGANRIVHNILRPTVTDFLELAFSDGMELSMEELSLPEGADLVGKELINSGIRSHYDLIVVAIRRMDGRMVYNPSSHEVLETGDILVVIGPQENLARFGRELMACHYPSLKPCKG